MKNLRRRKNLNAINILRFYKELTYNNLRDSISELMLEIQQTHLTPDKHHWYDQMITKGFAERNESYISSFENGNPSEFFRQTLTEAGGVNKLLVDIGCGPGKYTEMFALNYSYVVGLDRSANSIAFGLDHHKAPNLDFILGDAYLLPFKDDSFDVASSRLSPHLLSEIMRILKPGGFAITMRVGETDALELRRLFGQIELVTKMDGYIGRGEPHSRHILEQWRSAGFNNVTCTEHEYDMYFETIEDLAKYLSRIPIVPEFTMNNGNHMQILKEYAKQHLDPKSNATVLHRHRNIIKGYKQ